jgi:hypothetical protein
VQSWLLTFAAMLCCAVQGGGGAKSLKREGSMTSSTGRAPSVASSEGHSQRHEGKGSGAKATPSTCVGLPRSTYVLWVPIMLLLGLAITVYTHTHTI